MRLIVSYLKKYKLLLFINFIGILGFIVAELGIPTIVSMIVDHGIRNNDYDYINKMGLILVGSAIIGGLGSILLSYCASRISTYIIGDIREDIFAKTQTYSTREYNKFGISSMITRTTSDAYILMQFTNIILRIALLTPFMIVISFFMVITTSVNLSFVIIGSLPFVGIGVWIIAKVSNPISRKQQTGLDDLNRITRENLAGVRVIRAFRKNKYETKRFMETNESYTENSKRLFKLMSVSQPLFFLILNVVGLAIFWISAKMIDVGSLQVGELMAFLEYMFHILFSMLLFANVFVMYPRARVSALRIKELLDEEPSIKNSINGVQEGDGSTTLVFDHVTFQYPDGEVPVLQDINFCAKKGDTVAFIGSTGSGKSTLINLIPRFYDVSDGAIIMDGVDIRNYDLRALREKIGFIPQKALLFSGTIEENIQYGKHDALQDEIIDSAKVSQAYEFIQDKPEQFQEHIAEGGVNMSGGQRQRLSIARAVVRKPQIYIFDDSFSALDYKTDAKLRAKLESETQDAITLIVAQRVTSIMNATQIIVLNEGEVVAKGTHKDLLKTSDIYYEIASSQLSKEELDNE